MSSKPNPQIYLDNAATSWPKPESVYQAADRFQREVGACAGRGTHSKALKSSKIIAQTRSSLANFLSVPTDGDIALTFSCTDSLNLCLLGLLKPGDRVVTSVTEHNSVLRPLAHLRDKPDGQAITVKYIDCDDEGIIDVDSLRTALQTQTRLVVISHGSNVTGAIQPLETIATLAHENGALMVVDAAQTVGHSPISVDQLPIDMLAASGHKGLLGPLGTGFVYFAPGIAQQVTPLRFGGTGTASDEKQPESGPARFESGNLNVPGLAGLAAGVEYLATDQSGYKNSTTQSQFVLDHLLQLPKLRFLGPRTVKNRVGLASFTIEGYDCHDVAALLESSFGIQVRAGMHCAPRMHQRLAAEGTVRASWGSFTTNEELQAFVDAVTMLAK